MNKVFVTAVSALALVAGGCAHRNQDQSQGQSQSRSAGTVIDDSALTARVKTALATDIGAGTAAKVNVTTYRGTVQLSGVGDAPGKVWPENTARGVPGVQSVKNDLQVKSAAAGR
jgi:osmotically-inducible protein OsmY